MEDPTPDNAGGAPNDEPGGSKYVRNRRLWIGAALVIFLSSTVYFCFWQQPWADPDNPPKTFSLRWWVHPLEFNPYLRLASVPDATLNAVHFINLNEGWVVGERGLIMHTADGGHSWELQTNIDLSDTTPAGSAKPASDSKPVNAAFQTRRVDGYGDQAPNRGDFKSPTQLGDEELIKRKSFQQRNQFLSQPSSVFSKDFQAANRAVNQNQIQTNAQPLDQFQPPVQGAGADPVTEVKLGDLHAVTFADSQHGWCGGEAGVILVTTNGGRLWIGVDTPGGSRINSLAVPNLTNCWAGCETGFLSSQDGGETWDTTTLNSNDRGEIGAVRFVNSTIGWAVSHSHCWRTSDGGQKWEDIRSIHNYPDIVGIVPFSAFGANSLALVQDSKRIVLTQDAGRTWTTNTITFTNLNGPRVVASVPWPLGIEFVSETEAWAVSGLGPDIWRSTDGGVNWISVGKGKYNNIFFASPQNGWLVGKGGAVLSTGDWGKTWKSLTVSERADWDVRFVDSRTGIALGLGKDVGEAFKTGDGGATWELTEAPWGTNRAPTEFHAPSGLLLVRGTDVYDVSLWRISDQGTGWSMVASNVPFENFYSGNSTPLLASGRFEQRNPTAIFQSLDRGQSWAPFKYGNEFEKQIGLPEVGDDLVIQRDSGWTLSFFGAAWHSSDGGRIWNPSLKVPNTTFAAITAKDQEANIVGHDIATHAAFTIFTTNAGHNWVTNTVPSGVILEPAQFANPRTGWTIANGGVVVHTHDAGKTWTPQFTNSALALGKLSVLDEKHAWVTGARRFLAKTSDGQHWEALTQYRCWVAPIYAVCLVLSGLCLYGARRSVPKEQRLHPSITNHAINDNPMDETNAAQQDVLGFTDLASGIANYLENPNTRGPLTLAVLGAWGSGKSSLMNLLHARLRKDGMGTVWFNAWHEEHGDQDKLLAALIARIRSKGPPGWFVPGGIGFRRRLVARRLKRHKFAAICMAALSLAIGIWIRRLWVNWGVTGIGDFASHLTSLLPPGLLNEGTPKEEDWLTTLLQLLPLGGFAPVLFFIVKLMSVFNVDPARLVSSISEKGTSAKAEKESLNARDRFHEEFKEVCGALYPQILTIFVDDLDRCEPEQVMKMLQALNFLSSSGECFIVVGMQEKSVQEAIVKSFEWRAELAGPQGFRLTGAEQWQFAQQWLEKLIQIRVAVPRLSEDQLKEMLASKKSSEAQTDKSKEQCVWWKKPKDSLANAFQKVNDSAVTWWANGRENLLRYLGAVLFLLMFVGLLVCAWKIGHRIPVPKEHGRHAAANREGSTAATNGVVTNYHMLGLKWSWPSVEVSVASYPSNPNNTNNPGGSSPPPTKPDTKNKGAEPRPPALVSRAEGQRITLPPEQQGNHYITTFVILGVLALLTIYILLLKPRVRIFDSKAFEEAIDEWMPVIQEAHTTPRAIKRLINRLRFRAMIMRDPNHPESESRVADGDIVAYGVLEAVCPELIENSNTPLLANSVNKVLPSWMPFEQRARLATRAVQAVSGIRNAGTTAMVERLTKSVTLDPKDAVKKA